jgi:hypothetical protein
MTNRATHLAVTKVAQYVDRAPLCLCVQCSSVREKRNSLVIRLSTEDRAQLRLTYSVVHECVAAFRAMVVHRRCSIQSIPPQLIRASKQVELGLSPWVELRELVTTPHRKVPSFLMPTFAKVPGAIFDELRAIAGTAPDVIRREISLLFPGGVPPALEMAVKNPCEFLRNVTSAIGLLWSGVLADVWPVMQAKLESEISFRSRALAMGGPEALFDAIHPSIRLEQSMLNVRGVARTEFCKPAGISCLLARCVSCCTRPTETRYHVSNCRRECGFQRIRSYRSLAWKNSCTCDAALGGSVYDNRRGDRSRHFQGSGIGTNHCSIARWCTGTTPSRKTRPVLLEQPWA